MPTFEVLFKVGDAVPDAHDQVSHWEDGQIIAVKGPGLWWTKAELLAWANAGTEPPGYAALQATKKQMFNRFRLRFRRFTSPNFSRLYHINARFEGEQGIPINQNQLDNALAAQNPNKTQQKIIAADDECASQEAALQKQIDDIVTYGGLDTNWGFLDLSVHACVRVDATQEQLDGADKPWDDETVNVFGPRKTVARRFWKIDYQAFLTAQQIADVQDPGVFVPVDRVSAPIAAGVATAPVVRDLVNNPEGPGDGADP